MPTHEESCWKWWIVSNIDDDQDSSTMDDDIEDDDADVLADQRLLEGNWFASVSTERC